MKTLKITAIAALLATAGVAAAQTQPDLAISVAAPASVSTGADRTIATIGLNAGANDVTLESLPISLGYSNSQVAPFSNCALRNSAGGAALNTGANALGAQGSNDFTVTFDNPMVIEADTTEVLYLTCTIPATVPNENAVATSIFVSRVEATSNGSDVTVEGRDPQAGTTNRPVATAIINSATPSVPGTGTPTTPGVPNTGAGDSMVLWTLLAALGLVGAGAGAYALTRRA
ncbi:MAG: hypothetical protein KA066_02500 [Candidatus Pacebacteria bacterium]|nr:hypothetical protein [Candidatus Paceibacterota bacterium]